MTTQWGFHHDINLCIGCKACQMACKNEYDLEPDVNWRRVYPFREDPANPRRAFLSVSCNHCQQPECARVCPVSAFSKREDGIVVQERERCIGCRLCSISCPYGATWYSPAQRKSSKCELCCTRLDSGLAPVCVTACPMGALRLIDIASFGREQPAGAEVVHSVPGFPDNDITTPSIRFTLPVSGKQYRREV